MDKVQPKYFDRMLREMENGSDVLPQGNLGAQIERQVLLPEFIRTGVARYFTERIKKPYTFSDIVCLESDIGANNRNFLKKKLTDWSPNHFIQGSAGSGFTESLFSECTLRDKVDDDGKLVKNDHVKALMVSMPDYTQNNQPIGELRNLFFYHKENHYKIQKSLKLEYHIRNIDGHPFNFFGNAYGSSEEIHNHVPNKEYFDILYNNTIGFLKDRPKGVSKRGVVVYGDSGCGKTVLIKSIARIAIENKIHPCIVENSDVRDERFLSKLSSFSSRYKPSMIVFEDFDAMVKSREKGEGENTILKGLLSFLDGFHKRDKNIVILSTNYIEDLDSALKRPGRLDYFLKIDPPSDEVKMEYFKKRGVEESLLEEHISETKGMSFALIYEVLNRKHFEKDLSLKEIAEEVKADRKYSEAKAGFGQ
jgi:energy-coupling factor transporter ATP-binding protein EcfA2